MKFASPLSHFTENLPILYCKHPLSPCWPLEKQRKETLNDAQFSRILTFSNWTNSGTNPTKLSQGYQMKFASRSQFTENLPILYYNNSNIDISNWTNSDTNPTKLLKATNWNLPTCPPLHKHKNSIWHIHAEKYSRHKPHKASEGCSNGKKTKKTLNDAQFSPIPTFWNWKKLRHKTLQSFAFWRLST